MLRQKKKAARKYFAEIREKQPALTDQQLYYRLSSAFLVRMCISGDIFGLDERQRKILDNAFVFYESCKHVVKYGKTDIYGECSENRFYGRIFWFFRFIKRIKQD